MDAVAPTATRRDNGEIPRLIERSAVKRGANRVSERGWMDGTPLERYR